ncbi:MAG: hypothetical protein KatS3mg110_0338 [Pirellulaceae bacterium]|nr:MAG: hypothetical protein KatS3mg110_0338 [Pirellulaceae bacterium]
MVACLRILLLFGLCVGFLAAEPLELAAQTYSQASSQSRTVDTGSSPPHSQDDRLPSYSEYLKKMRELLRQEATAPNLAARAAVVERMCALFRQIVQDPRYVNSPVLQQYRGQLAARLRRVREDIERQMSRQRRMGTIPPASSSDGSSPELDQHMAAHLADTFELASQTLGGPSLLFGSASWPWLDDGRSGGAAVWDYGPALVELIQRTIVPRFWDVNGGPGTIVYYRPAMVLVVRATPGMHLEVADGLDRLRRGR